MVEEEGRGRVLRPARKGYKRRGGWIWAGGCAATTIRRERQGVFLMSRGAKRFRDLPEPLPQGLPPSFLRPELGCIANRAAGGPEKGIRCVRLHDSKTRCRGGGCKNGGRLRGNGDGGGCRMEPVGTGTLQTQTLRSNFSGWDDRDPGELLASISDTGGHGILCSGPGGRYEGRNRNAQSGVPCR
jgi:hypothetical protein